MYLADLVNDHKAAWKWAMEWVEDGKQGKCNAVKILRKTAEEIEERFYTNGMWAPGAEYVYIMLKEAAEMTKAELERIANGK